VLARFADRAPTLGSLAALVDYPQLSDHLKEQNRGVARDVPAKLAFLGYVLRQDAPAGVPAVVIDPADPRVELLARREHARYLAYKLKTGWRYGDPRDDAKKLHPCVLPWEELREEEREKDRTIIRKMPDVVGAAGMTLARSDERSELRVGVTGHRVLAETDRIATGIETALVRIEASHPGQSLVIVSALAEGADRLAVEAVLRRTGSRLEAVLPLPKYDFLEDFASPQSKDEFLRLLALAEKVVELPARVSREEAYAAANERLLDDIDVLIAVWDGQTAQGQGGTAEVVARARERHLPLAWVHAGNRKPGTMEPTSLGAGQGKATFDNL
jgi:hypothetical protein